MHGHLSSSRPETFGALAMSEPPDPETCASTLTHELQHLKLCAVLDVVSLTEPDDGRRYYAPGATTRGRSPACSREHTRTWA